MTVALYLPLEDKTQWWVDMLAEMLPGWTVKALDAVTDPAEVEYAVVWRPRTGDIAKFPNLKAVVSIGAGIDHVLADSELPEGVPIIRTVGDDLTQRMREYVALHVLRHHRDMPRQLQAQAEKDWHAIVVPVAPNRTVGVMGLGNLGAAAAQTLSALGFNTRGWSKSPKHIAGVETFAGPEGMDAFLDGCEILVNLLPLTEQTTGILNAELFGKLAEGACLINCARGPHLVDADLLEALESGQIKQATLDV
ncbi:MAG: glyoxylate/hydroxypyruvate reductase A, partial [Rhodobacteraceae bacterium]|nr:glyoxylate/hydroxypyruvate reductase A [Paracoccaceae bacterium]